MSNIIFYPLLDMFKSEKIDEYNDIETDILDNKFSYIYQENKRKLYRKYYHNRYKQIKALKYKLKKIGCNIKKKTKLVKNIKREFKHKIRHKIINNSTS